MSHPIHSFRIWPVLKAQSLQKFDFTHYEIRLNPHLGNQFPMPWDAGFDINKEGLIIEGSAGPCGFGRAEVVLDQEDYLRISEAEENEKPFWILVDMTLDQAAQVEQMGWEVKGNK